jgi:hypothetical protein
MRTDAPEMMRRPIPADELETTRARPRRAARAALCGLAVLLLPLIACYPGDALTVEEADVVVTLFDKVADFASKQSYAMPDSILHLVPEGETDDISRDYDAMVLSTVATNMATLGFTREGDPADADVFVLVSVFAQDQLGYAYYPWWGWYYPYSGCCWYGGWYPWYPASGAVYEYRSGTVFMEMVDPALADSTLERVPSIWVGAVNGLVEGNAVPERIADGITQAFEQSPYLGAGK